MTATLDAAMQSLDMSIVGLTALVIEEHESLMEAFGAVARELQWVGFPDRSCATVPRSLVETMRKRAHDTRRGGSPSGVHRADRCVIR